MGHMQCTLASDNNSVLSVVLGNRDILDCACKITSWGVREAEARSQQGAQRSAF